VRDKSAAGNARWTRHCTRGIGVVLALRRAPIDGVAVHDPRPGATEFEPELERRAWVSEQWRAVLLAAILTAILVVRLAYQGEDGVRGDALRGGSYLLVLSCWIGLESLTIVLLRQSTRRGREVVPYQAYVSAALEVAMPTTALALMCHFDRPLNVLTNSVTYAYFLIIILSPLRLDPWLCVFTGSMASVGYGLLFAAYHEQLMRQWVGSHDIMHLSFLMRGMLLLVGGLAAALVSHRIRTTLIETLAEVREREKVVALFGQHVSPAVVDRLLSQPKGEYSEVRDVCVMVLDIRNFTTFSEHRRVDEVVAYLNALWGFMVHTVNQHHGIVNKFLGDGFLAVFGAPLSVGNDCANGVSAARRILLELDALAANGGLPPTNVGIALHAGQAIVGNIGSVERKEYTVIGDVVNVAFRIESLNKDFGSRLLISEAVRSVGGIDGSERIPSIMIRGRSDPVELFRLA
jgi:adenylate cyclase